MGRDILAELQAVLQARKLADPTSSYVAGLYAKGLDYILKKIIEEAGEVAIAAKNTDDRHLIKEVADLWFHCMVLLAQKNLTVEDVQQELMHRFGVSGIEEKRGRGQS